MDQVKNTAFVTVNSMYNEFSYKQTSVVGTGAGWYTAAVNNTEDCNTVMDKIVTSAEAAATRDGIDFSSYNRRIYIFPYTSVCKFIGGANVGDGKPTTITRVWVNGANSPGTFAHELGHNLGLGHSNSLVCDAGPNQGNCTEKEYGAGDVIMLPPGHDAWVVGDEPVVIIEQTPTEV